MVFVDLLWSLGRQRGRSGPLSIGQCSCILGGFNYLDSRVVLFSRCYVCVLGANLCNGWRGLIYSSRRCPSLSRLWRQIAWTCKVKCWNKFCQELDNFCWGWESTEPPLLYNSDAAILCCYLYVLSAWLFPWTMMDNSDSLPYMLMIDVIDLSNKVVQGRPCPYSLQNVAINKKNLRIFHW